MELSLEMYRVIVKHVGSRVDLCTLCRVNKRFQRVAEWALYNTIYASDAWDTFRMCRLLARTPRHAAIVEALTLFVGDQDDSDRPQFEVRLPNNFWQTVSEALHLTTRLRFLKLHVDNAGDTAQAWILNNTTFRLRTFHCDLQWDGYLVSFLNTQPDIDDLYIVDYSVPEDAAQTSTSVTSLGSGALPKLSTLECTFAEAACALVPTRPISRLKTCFSKTRLPEKRAELELLFSKLMETRDLLHSLDIADSSYSESFSMDLLASVVRLQSRVHDLRYLGTLVLPIDGEVVRTSVSRSLLSVDSLYQASQVLRAFAGTPFSGVCRSGRLGVGTATTYSGRYAGTGKRAATLLSITPAGHICQRFREDGHCRVSRRLRRLRHQHRNCLERILSGIFFWNFPSNVAMLTSL